MKSIERPQQWHEEKRYKISQQWVDCWEVEFQVVDDEDYSLYHHFPCTSAGKRKAIALKPEGQIHKKNLRQTKVQVRDILPYDIRMNTPEWNAWCREWKIK